MQSKRETPQPLQALPIDSEDAGFLLGDIGRSFEIEIWAEAFDCQTAGDLWKLLLARLPAGEAPSLCATSMAFYRARAALVRLYGIDPRARPDWRLEALSPRPARKTLAEIARELNTPPASWTMSAVGGAGCLLMLGSAVALIANFFVHDLWSLAVLGLAVLGLAGVAMVALDRGTFGKLTLADLTRALARNRFAQLAAEGADSRPAAVWQALTGLLAEHGECGPAEIAPETRLVGA